MAYSQNDPRWKNTLLGFNTEAYANIGGYGCYITAISNVLMWNGKTYTPQQINDICKANHWFDSGGGFLNKDNVPTLIDGSIKYEGITRWNTPTPMSFFADADDPNVIYIICIDSSSSVGVQTHFVVVQGKSGANDLIIDDSWDGVRKNLSRYGSPTIIIQSATKFRKLSGREKPMTVEEEKNAYRIVLGREMEHNGSGRTGYQFITAAKAEVDAQRNAQAKMVADLQTALRNEQSKPPKEVKVEVERIVTEYKDKIVEITKEVDRPFTDQDGLNWLKKKINQLFGKAVFK